MTPDAHAGFIARLLTRLSEDPDVLGMVTLGSSSGLPPVPDASSDHDFFVVTRPGAQERFRADLGWLPDAADVVLQFRETAHGVKVLYASGHLAEFAVFDPDELALARVNRYRVLLDRVDVAARLAAAHAQTRAATGTPPDLHWHAGQFLTELVVAAGRATRGETLSGHQRIRAAALQHLLVLVRARHPEDARRDDLDATRRFEQVLPAIGHALDAALQLPVMAAARALLALADRELGPLLPAAARDAVAKVLGGTSPST